MSDIRIDPSDHQRGQRRSGRLGTIAAFLALMILLIAAAVVLMPEMKAELRALGLFDGDAMAAVYKRLGVPPLDVASTIDPKISRALASLAAEPCEGQSVLSLANAVAKGGAERWAADALEGWSKACAPDNARQLRRAADLYILIHDYARALATVDALLDAHPGTADYWYLKGKAEAGLGHQEAALVAYANCIHLTANPAKVGEWVFREMSDLYVASRRYCEAIGPIEDYVALAPATRSTPANARLIETLTEQGRCTNYVSGSATFSVASNNVIHVRATVDGVSGTFVVDTGATFVTVDSAFAKRAHLTAGEAGPVVRSDTANGAVYQKLVTAEVVKVGGAQAKSVAVAILDKPLGAADGLLGRSFLSRFDIAISGTRWSLHPRAAPPSSLN